MDGVGWALAHRRAACGVRRARVGLLRHGGGICGDGDRVMPPARCRHVELPPRLGARRHLLLHREPAGASPRLARRTHRPAARCIPGGEGGATVPSAGHRGDARPPALRVAVAGRRRRQCQPLGTDQIRFQPGVAHPRTPIIAAYRPPGAGHLATTLLGAPGA